MSQLPLEKRRRGFSLRRRGVLPGFGLTLGYTIFYVGLLVLLPLFALVFKSSTQGLAAFVSAVTDERALIAYWLSFRTALAGAAINAVFGVVVAWVLVRYTFPGKSLLDALVDLPFALPTAVAGIALTAVYSENGWVGSKLMSLGVKVAFTQLGIIVALTFIGIPFVVRTVQPVLESLDLEVEEAAAILGANRWQTFNRVLFPTILPAVLTGMSLAFARALGEYGSVIFVSGNKPFDTEIAPVLIVSRLEAFQYSEATALAVVLLSFSFAVLAVINILQRWSQKDSS